MRAFLSVYDKSGVVDLAAGLHELGWDLVSSGGTAAALRDSGLAVTELTATGAASTPFTELFSCASRIYDLLEEKTR